MMDMANTQESYPSGKISTKTVRFSFNMEPNKNWRFTSEGTVSRKDTDIKNMAKP